MDDRGVVFTEKSVIVANTGNTQFRLTVTVVETVVEQPAAEVT